MPDPTMLKPPVIFEYLIHLLEISVVVGIGAIIYITKKHPISFKGDADPNKQTNPINKQLEAPEAPAEIAMFKSDKNV